MSEHAFEALLETAWTELMGKQESLDQSYALGSMARWWLDLEAETLQFFGDDDQLLVTAKILYIGSFLASDSSWMWGWSNASIPVGLRQKAQPLKQLQSITGIELFADERAFKIEDEGMAWQMAAIAIHHLNALGCYRAPSSAGGATTFLAITHLERVSH